MLGGVLQDLRAFVLDVLALVARLDHRLQRHAVGHGAGLDALRVADGAAAELQDHVVAEQAQQLVHLAGVDAAGGHGHDLLGVGPVHVEEQAARQVDLRIRVAADVVVALHGERVALQLADGGAGVQVVAAGQAQPLGDHAEAHAMVLLPRVGAVTGAVHVHDHVVLAAPVGHALDGRPADHQVDHDHHAAQVLGELGALVHVFHRRGGDVQVAALHLARGGAGFIDAVHHVQEAVAPVHEGLRVDVLVVLHEVQATLQAFVDHAAVVAARQAQLGLGGGAQQRAAELVEALALDHQAGGRALEGLDVGHGDAHVLQARGLQRLEREHVADQAGRHVGDRAFFEQDQVVGDPGEVLAGGARHRLYTIGLGAVAVAGRQAVGPHHRPGGGAGFAGHGGGGFLGVHAVLRRDAEQADGVRVAGHVVGHPVAHLLVLQHARAVALLGVGDLTFGGGGGHRGLLVDRSVGRRWREI